MKQEGVKGERGREGKQEGAREIEGRSERGEVGTESESLRVYTLHDTVKRLQDATAVSLSFCQRSFEGAVVSANYK